MTTATLIQPTSAQTGPPMADDGQRYLSQREAAVLLGVSLPTFARFAKAHELRLVRVGAKTVRYRRADLIAAIERAEGIAGQ